MRINRAFFISFNINSWETWNGKKFLAKKWRKMNEGEFRNDATKKDKSSGMLTVDEVLTTKGFEHFTKEEAEEYIESIRKYCLIRYKLYFSLNNSSDNFKNKR